MFNHAISSVSWFDGPVNGGSAEDSDNYGMVGKTNLENKWALTTFDGPAIGSAEDSDS